MNDASQHPPPPRKMVSIRSRMVLAFGLLFATIFIVVTLISMFGIPGTPVRGTFGAERGRVMRDLDFIAGLKEERLQVWVKERRSNLRMITHCEKIIGSTRMLRQAIARRGLRPDQPAFQDRLQREPHYALLHKELLTMQEIYLEYNTLCIIDARLGNCIVSTDTAHLGKHVIGKRFIREALERPDGEGVDLELHSISGKPNIVFTRLIADDAERPLAVLVAHVDADAFIKPMLYTGEHLGTTDEVMIFDEYARPLVALRYPLADGRTARMLVDSIPAPCVALALQGSDGVTADKDYRGKPVLAAFRHVNLTPDRGIALILKRDEAEITRAMWQRTAYLLFLALCGILVVLVLTGIIATRISRPIIELSNTAHEVESGNLTARAKSVTRDEVGRLATVFNSMLSRVQEWHAELEREVETRSGELRKINQELKERIVRHEHAEMALRESKEFAEKLINLMQDGFAVYDTKGVHVSVNPSLCRMTGFSADELIGTGPPHPYWPEEELEKFQSTYREMLISKPREFEVTLKTRNGKCFPVLVSPSQTRDGKGNVNFYFVTIKDISERKRVLEALRQSEEKYRLHFEYASDIIYSIDRDMRLLSVSPSVEKVLGYKPEELVGRNIADLNIIAQEHIAAFARDLAQIQKGEQVPTPVYAFVTRTGERRFGEVSGAPLYRNRQVIGVVSVARDITEHIQTDEELKRSNRALRIISSCNMALVRATEERELLNDICRSITDIGGYLLAWVGYAENDRQKRVRVAAHAGKKIQYIKRQKLTWANTRAGNTPFGAAIREKRNYACHNAQQATVDTAGCKELEKIGFESLVVLPLVYGDDVLGILSIHAAAPNAFDDQEIALLQELADDLTYGIQALRAHIARREAAQELERSYAKLRKTLEETVNALASATEKRDPYTAGHQRSVTQLACAIAQEMDLTENEIEGIRIAGLLHDIGKISVPAEILSKPGSLSESEFAIIKLHSEIGYDILKTIDFPWPVARIAYEHHERLNGSGYPRGVTGNEILLESKIVAVADVVEAMSSHRPYRPARTIRRTIEEIKNNRGVLYDKKAVDACARLFARRKFKFKRT